MIQRQCLFTTVPKYKGRDTRVNSAIQIMHPALTKRPEIKSNKKKLNSFRLTGRRSLLYWSGHGTVRAYLCCGTIFRTHVSNEKRNSKTSVLTKQAEIKRLETSAGFFWWDKKNFVLTNRRTGQFRKAKVCIEWEFIYGWSRIKQENSLM